MYTIPICRISPGVQVQIAGSHVIARVEMVNECRVRVRVREEKKEVVIRSRNKRTGKIEERQFTAKSSKVESWSCNTPVIVLAGERPTSDRRATGERPANRKLSKREQMQLCLSLFD